MFNPIKFNSLLLIFCFAIHALELVDAAEQDKRIRYEQLVLKHSPTAYWRFNESELHDQSASALKSTAVGKLQLKVKGPRPATFPYFEKENTSIRIDESAAFIRVPDPGVKSALDFDTGDTLTLEAWVNPQKSSSGRIRYIIGKGRTNNPGLPPNNQNYALRLSYNGAESAKLNFLFRSRGKSGDWHRWTSSKSISTNDGWHHVAVTYTFGKSKSLKGYIDGSEVKGKWDMGGATGNAPIVDNDELWIGSTLGGSEQSTFRGALDEIAIYRKVLTSKQIKAHFLFRSQPLPPIEPARLADGDVLVELFEGISSAKTWTFRTPQKSDDFLIPAFGFVELPNKYNSYGIRVDRSNPLLLRATGKVYVPVGKQRILLRARNAARLKMDGKLLAETKFHNISSSAHGVVFDVDTSLAPNIRPLLRGDTEQVAEIEGDGREHLFELQMIVGGGGHRLDLGETSVSMGPPKQDFQLLGNNVSVLLTDDEWRAYTAQQHAHFLWENQRNRQQADVEGSAYWAKRHASAREYIRSVAAPEIPRVKSSQAMFNEIDRFINHQLEEKGQRPSELTSDSEFLRRLALDVIGTIPTASQIKEFENDTSKQKRKNAIDRLLQHRGWADNWVGYWQDVLAENPNIIKPTLNNTGPFRWWIHESFLDNKPFDRFASELIMMEGSVYFGGPGGFKLATQNDVPMAAKAHIVAQAFLGLEMKCARCHDAPFRDFKQQDLFSLAAMLGRKPLQVPKTSTVPGGDIAAKSLIIEVTLKPGQKVSPEWAFKNLISSKLSHDFMKNSQDSRELAAAYMTSPQNHRFAKVIVNRMWQRYLGRGIVMPVDDWDAPEISHPQLLNYLAYQLVLHNYDLKHIARLIFNSHLYQRKARDSGEPPQGETYLFASPLKRRMTAEQIVDSIFLAAAKPFDSGQITVDIDGAMRNGTGFNLGEPTRSWQFASLSNERDRPSLALPFAQPFITTLETFGWRSSRQDPITIRDNTTTALQPASLANGILGRRVCTLSDESAFTQLALNNDLSVEMLIELCSLRVLSRKPTSAELSLFKELLQQGFEKRVVSPKPVKNKPQSINRNRVAWSNHLNSQANEIQVELEKAVEKGETPTDQLNKEWRERMEDMLWAMFNSPEFVFIP